jgi:hypothetical protein
MEDERRLGWGSSLGIFYRVKGESSPFATTDGRSASLQPKPGVNDLGAFINPVFVHDDRDLDFGR